jgi:Tfp pilus assembly protein PilO
MEWLLAQADAVNGWDVLAKAGPATLLAIGLFFMVKHHLATLAEHKAEQKAMAAAADAREREQAAKIEALQDRIVQKIEAWTAALRTGGGVAP